MITEDASWFQTRELASIGFSVAREIEVFERKISDLSHYAFSFTVQRWAGMY